jgi:hypothetical protein
MIANQHSAYKAIYELQLQIYSLHQRLITLLESGKLLHELGNEQDAIRQTEQQLQNLQTSIYPMQDVYAYKPALL